MPAPASAPIHGRLTTVSSTSILLNFQEFAGASGAVGSLAQRSSNGVTQYILQPTVSAYVVDAVTITCPDGFQYRMPSITLIGFDPYQVALVDKFIGALQDRLRTDPTFHSQRAMQGLMQQGSESYLTLNGGNELAGNLGTQQTLPNGTPPQFTGAVTAGLAFRDPLTGIIDQQTETVVNTGDSWLIGDPTFNDVNTRVQFLNRVLHEWTHGWHGHAEGYDTALGLLGNLNAPRYTTADVIAADYGYGAGPDLLRSVAHNPDLVLSSRSSSTPELDSLQQQLAAAQAKRENAGRTRGIMQAFLDQQKLADTDPGILLSRTVLDQMVHDRYIVYDQSLDKSLSAHPTSAEIDASKNNRHNYKLNATTKAALPDDIEAKIHSIDDRYRQGLFSSLDAAIDELLGYVKSFFAEYSSELGQILGSTLGQQLLKNENAATRITGTTFLGVLGQNLGEELELSLRGHPLNSATKGFSNFGEDLRNAGIGAVSSFLTAELFESMGLEGTLAELGQSVFAHELSAMVTAIAANQSAANVLKAVTDVASLAQVVGGFIGTKLAQELVHFDTIEGQIGASIGSAFGAIAGAKIGLNAGARYGFWGAVIGAFVGFIVGGIVGTFFSTTPRSGAELIYSDFSERFYVGPAWSKGPASKDGARSVTANVAEMLNAVIVATGSRVAGGSSFKLGSYGTYEQEFVWRMVDSNGKDIIAFRSLQANYTISYGLAYTTAQLLPRLVGGDVFVKRALAATLAQAGVDVNALPQLQAARAIVTYPRFAHANRQYDLDALALAQRFDVNVLLGNLSTAQDYKSYLSDRTRIDAIIAAEPDSAFAATWAITFARAWEMGLNRRGASDWTGGWNAYLDEINDGKIDGSAFSAAVLAPALVGDRKERLIGVRDDTQFLGADNDTIDNAAKDLISGGSGADSITVANDRIASTTGLTINGTAASGSEYQIQVAAAISGLGGNDVIRAGDLGNDLLGGDGNDTLVGGKLDDWLFGEAGNDRLLAGAPANVQFSDGDTAAVTAALSTLSNGDMLDGGDGDDLLYGSRGSDWLRGGAGVDTLRGGAGGDIIDGGAGNDRGPNGEARLLGGAGTDQYVFGYGSGSDVVFDEADAVATPGSTGDTLYSRITGINNGTIARDWAGGGSYEVDGSVRGGEDAVAFGAGITMQDIVLRRSGTQAAPGQDLIIQLTYLNPTTGVRSLTGDQLEIRDWFETSRRVEWLRFMNGDEMRLGDITSFIIGTSGQDVIVGTQTADFLYGGDGNDSLFGLGGDDFGFGGDGNDLVAGDEDNDLVAGGGGNDTVIGGQGNDTVFGDDGNDRLNGGDGSDVLAGGRGDDEVIGGAGNDIFKFERGDGRDILQDAYVDNWELVWQNGAYVNGYSLDPSTGLVTKGGVAYFDGTQWNGIYDYADATRTLRRHLGPIGGTLAANSGSDYLQFGVGIDIQDLMLRRTGNNLEIAVQPQDSDAATFDSVADRVTVRDWYITGTSIESFAFAATGVHNLTTTNIVASGSDNADSLNGTTGDDWITGNAGDDTISGNSGADILVGNAGNDTLRGDAGKDVLYGSSGDDILDGGADADVLIGGSGFDIASYASAGASAVRAFLNAPGTNTGQAMGDSYYGIDGLEGTTGADRLGGDDNGNVLRGLAGNDSLFGGAGDDIYEFDAANGQDTINDQPFTTEVIVDSTGAFNSTQYRATWTHLGVVGTNRRFRLVVTRIDTGEQVYRSRDGVDFVYATSIPSTFPMPAPRDWPASNNQWSAAAGVTRPNAGTDPYAVRELFVAADGGIDTVEFGAGIGISDLTFSRLNSGADLRITYSSGNYVTISGQNDPNRAVEVLTFRDGLTADLTRLVLATETATKNGDLVVGDSSANTLDGLAGNDVISGAGGADTLRGGDGDDILEGGSGGDTLDGGNDSLTSGEAIDYDSPAFYGDTIRYTRSGAAVTVDLGALTASGGHAAGDVIVAANGVSTIENVVGSDGFGDVLRGDARANRLAGLGGNDTLEGNGGDDVLVGGAGDDTLRGGDGNDSLTGEVGNDTIFGGNGKDLLAGGDGNDSLTGDAGDDVLSGAEGDDTLHGGADNDILGGDAGVDQLYGDAGDDQLAGGDGNDQLYGGDGNDSLFGDAGNDQLSGDLGDDTYAFSVDTGSDTIVDASGVNKIVFNDATTDQLWITRSGNDLRIGVIGGTSVVTVQGYYASSTPTRLESVTVGASTLALASAQPLIQAMTAASATTPAAIPASLVDLVANYWAGNVDTAPAVSNQVLSTNEDTALSGSVAATDPDNNITGYSVATSPTHGSLNLNATTGVWTYTPASNYFGTDAFNVLVTDAQGQTANQLVSLTVTSVNDAPTAINAAGLVTSIDERDRPITGSSSPAVVLATLSVVDPDAGDTGDFATHAYTVSDSRFEVVGGQLRLKSGVALDYETATSVTFNVTATDRNGAGLSVTRGFTFAVNNRDDYFYGTSGNDNITGTAGANFIYGQNGNDTLTGAGANDTLDGGDGNDTLNGLGGVDTLYGQFGDDTLDGGTGDDTLRGGDGNDTLRGSDGVDQLYGDAGLDILQGGLGNDTLEGGDNDDQLDGGDGNDTLRGGNGNDTLVGGLGADRFNFGAGTADILTYANAAAGVTLSLVTGGTGGEASGDVFEDAPERVIGSAFADNITGSAGIDIIEGGAGNDIITGGAGDDLLYGGDGNDTIDAQAGDDTLDGGLGNDILIGGIDNDRYVIAANSGADEIRNFDPNGTDIDSVGYSGITRDYLWFERSGNDLIVTAVGTTARTTIKDWYVTASATDRSNYKIDFFETSAWNGRSIDAEALVTLMAGYTRPTTAAAFDTLHANSAFQTGWSTAWRLNSAPTLGSITSQTVNEDGSLSVSITVNDDITTPSLLTVTGQAVNPGNTNLADSSIVTAVNVTSNGGGSRTLTGTLRPNASGQTAIKVTVTDGGGLSTSQVFVVNVTPVADAPPAVALPTVPAPTAPATQYTFDPSGWIALNGLAATLADTDGSESISEVRISNVPSGVTFNQGTNLGGGVWSITPGQFSGLRLQAPISWSQDLSLTFTSYSRESANGVTAPGAASTLNLVINARPTDIGADRTLSFAENQPLNSGIAWLSNADADGFAGATYSIVDNAGGRFAVRSDGLLMSGNTNLDYEDPAYASHVIPITVRVTDVGGLSYDKSVNITLTNVNEAPTGLAADRSLSFSENTALNSGIAWYTRTDPDVGDSANFTMINNAGGRFAMRSDGLLMTGNTNLDYEDPGSPSHTYSITVRVTDGAGNSRDVTDTVTVLNAVENPVVNGTTLSVSEGLPGAGTSLGPSGQISGTAYEGVGSLRYEIYNNSSPFTINSSGQLFLQGTLDYEGLKSYSLNVRGWDGGSVGVGNVGSATVTVNVTNINEAPRYSAADPRPHFNTASTHSYNQSLIGSVSATDPEGDAITWLVQSATMVWHETETEFGTVIRDENVAYDGTATVSSDGQLNVPGLWPYEHFEWPGNGTVYTVLDRYTQYYDITIVARDPSGATSQPVSVRAFSYRADQLPVVLDLDGDGVELVDARDAKAQFAMLTDTSTLATGWVGADDAFLALDRNGDGVINDGSEISFVQDLPDAISDLDGLSAFDTNGNGQLDAGDERFGEFRVWQDANQDGVSQSAELQTLTERGIASIGLLRTLTGDTPDGAAGNVITATSDFTRLDGTRSTAADVSIAAFGLRTEVLDTPPQSVAAASGEFMPDIDGDFRDHRTARLPNHGTVGATSEGEVDIDSVDRGAHSQPAPKGKRTNVKDNSPDFAREQPIGRIPQEQKSAFQPAQEARGVPQRTRPWRISDPELDNSGGADDAWQPGDDAPAAQTALHAALDSITRRRLQMIDAMAGFDGEGGAAELSLRPHRHVDQRTLAMLTSVPQMESR
jgi:Ca2+-binding RTX toxin-like protein